MEPKFLSLLAFYNFKLMFSYNPFLNLPFSAWVHKAEASLNNGEFPYYFGMSNI